MTPPSVPGQSRSVVGYRCHDCEMPMARPSDLMRHRCPIGEARRYRLHGGTLSPSYLHGLCNGDSDLYRHAMREAGMLVPKSSGEPEDPCSVCGWSPRG